MSMHKIIRMYNNTGFKIKEIHCNNQFRRMLEGLRKELGCTVTYTSTHDNASHGEKNNIIIKNQIVAGLRQTTYRKIPRVMV